MLKSAINFNWPSKELAIIARPQESHFPSCTSCVLPCWEAGQRVVVAPCHLKLFPVHYLRVLKIAVLEM